MECTAQRALEASEQSILVPYGAVFPLTSASSTPTRAKGADMLIHEVVDLAAFSGPQFPPALVAHLKAVPTDVSALGAIAAQSGVQALAATHLSPADPAQVSDSQWRTLLRESASKASYHGQMILGQDLMRIQVTPRGPQPVKA